MANWEVGFAFFFFKCIYLFFALMGNCIEFLTKRRMLLALKQKNLRHKELGNNWLSLC